jgi:hypothetical protein
VAETEPGEAMKWMRKAADHGHPKASFRMAMAFDSGDGITANKKIAVSWLRRAAHEGYAEAQYELGRRCVLSDDPEYAPMDGIKWYEQAARQGHLRAQYGLAMCLFSGRGVARDRAGAYYWMSLAAEGGLHKAEHRLPLLEEQLDNDVLREARQRLSRSRTTASID